jgi:hypothetical protein
MRANSGNIGLQLIRVAGVFSSNQTNFEVRNNVTPFAISREHHSSFALCEGQASSISQRKAAVAGQDAKFAGSVSQVPVEVSDANPKTDHRLTGILAAEAAVNQLCCNLGVIHC